MSTTHVATSRRSSSVACSAIRRSASSRGDAPRLEPLAAAAPRGASTTITAPYSKPPRRLDEQRHVVHDDPVGRRGRDLRGGTPRRSPGCVIASSCLRVSSVTNARSASAARSSEPSAGRISGPNASASAASAGCPGLDHFARDRVGVDHHRAPLDEHPRHRRLARPDAAREPDHEHDRRVYEPPRTASGAARPASAGLRIRCRLPTKRVKPDVNSPAPSPGGAHCGPTQTTRRIRPPGGRAGLERRGRAPDRGPARPAHRHDPVGDDPRRDPLRRPAPLERPLRARRRSRSSPSRAIQTFHQIAPDARRPASGSSWCSSSCSPSPPARVTGGLASPFVLTPVTGLLLAGYVWGRRATVGTAIAGVHRGRGHDRDAVGRRDRPARRRPDRRRLPALRRARRVHPQPDQRDREPPGRRDRPGRRDGHRQRAARLAARARADAAGVVRPARGRRLDARSGCARSCASARSSCSCATTRSRCGPSSSPKACGSPRT